MLRDFKLAASTYDLVRKDAASDKAWPDFAAATVRGPPWLAGSSRRQRMLGLCYLAQSLQAPTAPRQDTDSLLEQAMAGMPTHDDANFDELKATCLYHDAYRALGEVEAASRALARCAGEARRSTRGHSSRTQIEEISSGLLLEQAAIADLSMPRPRRRKFAFHLCMAAQRYEKAGLVRAKQALLRLTYSESAGKAMSDPRDARLFAVRVELATDLDLRQSRPGSSSIRTRQVGRSDRTLSRPARRRWRRRRARRGARRLQAGVPGTCHCRLFANVRSCSTSLPPTSWTGFASPSSAERTPAWLCRPLKLVQTPRRGSSLSATALATRRLSPMSVEATWLYSMAPLSSV